MPRLGDDDAPPQRRNMPRFPTSAYPKPGSSLNNVIMLLAIAFILRNIFFTDYRTEEIKELAASGKSPEEIKDFVPQSSLERRQTLIKNKNEFDQMKLEIASLREELQDIRKVVHQQNEEGIGRYNMSESRKDGLNLQANKEGEIIRHKKRVVQKIIQKPMILTLVEQVDDNQPETGQLGGVDGISGSHIDKDDESDVAEEVTDEAAGTVTKPITTAVNAEKSHIHLSKRSEG